jgi:hypothetical protein
VFDVIVCKGCEVEFAGIDGGQVTIRICRCLDRYHDQA